MQLDVFALLISVFVVLVSAIAVYRMSRRRMLEKAERKSLSSLESDRLEPESVASKLELTKETQNLPEELPIIDDIEEAPEKEFDTDIVQIDKIHIPTDDTDEIKIKDKQEEVSKYESKDISSAEIATSTEDKLNLALKNTKQGFWGRIQGLFGGGSDVDWDSIEEVLYTSDLGPKTVQRLMDALDEKLSRADKSDVEKVHLALKNEMIDILNAVQEDDAEQLAGFEYEIVNDDDSEIKPVVWMIVGVNGAGKTTTIGKLASLLTAQGKKVMLAAGDTFRAAADAQLKVWSERAEVEIFSPENVKDPSAVAFDACKKAQAQGFDHLIVDTAGRLHTQSNLMEELKKMKRVVDKAYPGAPHETLLVIDANNGQNALIQAKEFDKALDLTGVILTKMDGTAKGGVVLGVAHELELPIKRIGVGEKIEDLRSFSAKDFVDAII